MHHHAHAQTDIEYALWWIELVKHGVECDAIADRTVRSFDDPGTR